MTIKDIAKEAGYAVSTVSRALNDHPDVSEEAKLKIKAIVEKTGFVPNNNARQLKVQQSRNILILVKGVFNPFFADILERIQTEISSAKYSAQVHYLDEDANEVLVGIQLQKERKPLGFLFLGGNVDLFKKRFHEITVPSVLATTVSQDLKFDNLTCVGIDDMMAGYAACEYLLEKKHRNIAVLGGKRDLSYISALRYEGFCNAYQKTGDVHAEQYYESCSYNINSGYRAMQRLLQKEIDITAVFCMSDMMAIGAMRAIHDAKLSVPQDISVLGFDGIEMARYCIPRLTTIRQPQRHIAQRSVEKLVQAIERDMDSTNAIFESNFVEGESVRAL